jgi:methylenetetrahydrofolate dehydrogenase (NADP+)/methenyltetrahydrofolate cyclohydrolase
MAKVLKGAPVARAITEQVAARVAELSKRDVVPKLAILRVGERQDDLSYERGAAKRADRCGIVMERVLLPPDCSQADLMDAIARINADDTVHGCLMFRPLPKTLDEAAACAALAPAKDVDGITQGSLYGIFANRKVGYPPCTAQAVLELLDFYGYELEGADAVVVGRSLVIGKPVSMMLQARNATVTMCHTRTRDLAARCREADLVVAAAGHAGTVGADCVREGQVVVDVGINWDEEEGRIVGDVDFGAVEPVVSAISPVPGGVGAVTTAVLFKHVVDACERSLS